MQSQTQLSALGMLNSKKMNALLVTVCLTSVLTCVAAAPAVSSVHVTFVSGNKVTHYSHEAGDDGSVNHFNSLDERTSGDHHVVRKRSVTRRPPNDPGGVELLKVPNRKPAPSTSTQPTSHDTNKIFEISASTENALKTSTPTDKVSTFLSRGAAGRSVAFVKVDSDEILNDKVPLKFSTHLRSGLHHEERVETASSTTLKPKDTKAVKRSPQFHDNYLGSFDFPDFDEFGGNDFGHPEREFEESPHDSEPHHQHNNVESMAPDGVFLPPVPTQASNYVESDPYLAEPEVANYAVQHVPYFHEFPHKRTVLALNERREENGLEPNVLRSIRPFFAFFEINNKPERRYYGSSHAGHTSPQVVYHFHSGEPADVHILEPYHAQRLPLLYTRPEFYNLEGRDQPLLFYAGTRTNARSFSTGSFLRRRKRTKAKKATFRPSNSMDSRSHE